MECLTSACTLSIDNKKQKYKKFSNVADRKVVCVTQVERVKKESVKFVGFNLDRICFKFVSKCVCMCVHVYVFERERERERERGEKEFVWLNV